MSEQGTSIRAQIQALESQYNADRIRLMVAAVEAGQARMNIEWIDDEAPTGSATSVDEPQNVQRVRHSVEQPKALEPQPKKAQATSRRNNKTRRRKSNKPTGTVRTVAAMSRELSQTPGAIAAREYRASKAKQAPADPQ